MNVRANPSEPAKVPPASSAPNIELEPDKPKTISPNEARAFRQRAIANGYALIRVGSGSKKPRGHNWQQGEDAKVLLNVQSDALNTGLLTAGFRCLDIDVDDPQLVSELIEQARAYLPQGALTRGRPNSPRVTIFYRAAEGQPPKRVIKGPNGKIEVLGAGQQVVVHGLHPSGAPLTWADGLGPDTVDASDVPAVSEEQINDCLSACAPLLGESVVDAGAASAFPLGPRLLDPGFVLPATARPSLAPVVNDLSAGIETLNWFSELSADEKRALVEACLNALDNRSSDPREVWLRVLFAVADAERLGCPDAPKLALEWSQRGTSWTSEADFETAYNSYKSKPGGVTIGSLLAMARSAGLDLSKWRDPALERSQGAAPGPTTAQPAPSGTATDPYSLITIDPNDIPPHRQWSVGTRIIKGEVSILAAKGGWGKSAYSISTACSAASGRDLLDLKIWGGPKRVLYINSEDDTDELRRRFIAAARHHKLTKADLELIRVRGVNTPGHETLTTGDESAPRLNEAGLDALDAIITKAEPDIVFLDPLGTFCPAGLNHNGIMSQVLLRLKRLARKQGCGILVVHHTRKDGDLTNTDAIGGASAIVNQARVAMMIARMTAEEAKNFKGILSSEMWRYFRIVDAKTNLAPPTSNAQWYQLVSHELPNTAPPTYVQGDGVQVVDKVDPIQLNTSPVAGVTDDAAKRAILKAAHSADPPFSPSSRGGSDRYIVRRVLGAVRQATGMDWADRDLTKHVESLVREMMSVGWLRVEDVKVGGNKRQGVGVNYALTPWAHEFSGGGPDQPPTDKSHQIPQKPFETIEGDGAQGIDARRTEGASNVPKRCGGLTQPGFDTTETDCAAAVPPPPDLAPAVPADVGVGYEPPAVPVRVSRPEACMPSPVAVSVPADKADDLDIPPFLRRSLKPAKPVV